jgi:hypothetical protein
VNPKDTNVVLGIDPTDRYPMIADSRADETHPDAALYRDQQHPARLMADLDEKQHALAFEMQDGVAAGGASC